MLHADFESDTPIYLQLKNQIIISIANGEYEPGFSLPSVRALAAELEINMHTVNKVYRILRDEGYITLDRRKGAIILPPSADEEEADRLRELILPVAARARCKGLGKKDFRRLCTQVYEELRGETE